MKKLGVIVRTKAAEDTFIPYGFCRDNE